MQSIMKIEWKNCLSLAASLFLLYLGIQYWPSVAQIFGALLGAATPLIVGSMIAYIINILMSFYERHYFSKSNSQWATKSRRPVCMVAAFATLVAVVVLIIWLVVPQLVACIQLIAAELPDSLEKASDWINQHGILPENIAAALAGIDWKARIGQILQTVTSGLGNVMDVVFSAVSSAFSGIMTAIMGTIFAIYLLLGKETLSRQLHQITRRYLKSASRNKLYYIMGITNDCFHKYIVGQCTEAVILGMLCTVGMLILRLPYATMIGALVAFTALIPVAGAYIGAAVGAFMILTVSPVQAVIFLVYLVVLQQLEGNLIYPKVVGSSMGLPAIWVLAAVTLGGGVMGIPGMLLGVPLAATLYRLLRDDVKTVSVMEQSA